MKKSTVAQKMRWTAGVLYLVLCVYQMAVLNTIILGGSAVQYFVWTAAVLLIPVAGAMAIWMFSGDNVFSAGTRRGVVVGTAWFVAFELLTYSGQVQAINYTLSSYDFTKGIAGNNMALYALLIVRLLLMILAAFFVTSVRDNLDYTSEKKSKDGEAAPAATVTAAKPGAAAAAADLDKPLDVAKKEEPKKEVYKAEEKPAAPAPSTDKPAE